MATSNPDISVVIPVFNSAATIIELAQELLRFFEETGQNGELVLVNDGSIDDSGRKIHDLAKSHGNVKALSLFRNFGQINACMTGFRLATADTVILMDDDMQNSPRDIRLLLDKLAEGYDFVFAVPRDRPIVSWRTWGSLLNSKMGEVLIKKPRHLELSSFLAIRKSVLDYVVEYNGPFPYLAGLIFQITHNGANVDVGFKKRRVGRSGYTFRKLIRLWINGFTNFSIVPLRLATLLGLATSALGFALAAYFVSRKLMGLPTLEGWTSLQASILVFSGAQLLCIGMLGEYVGRVFMISNKQPQSAVRQRSNC
jgi:glycosyltransferase involved in cell wall biosynthesis